MLVYVAPGRFSVDPENDQKNTPKTIQKHPEIGPKEMFESRAVKFINQS